MTAGKRQYIPPVQRTNRPVKGRVIYKQVTYTGSSGSVYLPPAWIGKQVRVTLLTDSEVTKLKQERKIVEQ